MGLGDLKSQLLKAGVVSKKQAKKVAHQQRKERSAKGQEAIEAEKEARRQRLAEEEERRRQADKEREAGRRAEDEAREVSARIGQMASTGELDREGRPNKRWYFEARDGRLPYMAVDESLQRQLERGRAALVESDEGETWIVGSSTAARIRDLDAAWIRVWNQR